MSQYLSITFKVIYCISINVLIIVSESNNQTFQISDSNHSLILNKNYDSKSYYYVQNGPITQNSTNIYYESVRKNNGKFLGKVCDNYYKSCDDGEKCCLKRCINLDSDCKGMRVWF